MFDGINENKFDETQLAQIKREREIDKMIKTLPRDQSRLPYTQQRKIALKLMGESEEEYLDLQNNSLILIDIEKIYEEKQKYLKEESSKIEDNKMTEEQKILKILNDLNSSKSYECEIKKEVIDNISDIYNSYNSESTMDTTIKSLKTSYYDESDPKGEFWIKNNYYDISNIGKNLRKGLEAILIRDKTKEHFAFLYYDYLYTYDFAISKYFCDYKFPKDEPRSEHYNPKYGFCFCGKEIKEFNKTCSPNEMMCNECMEENIQIYGLDRIKNKHVLININGRASFNNFKDKKFKCAGKFLINKKIYNCLPEEFSCRACSLLNEWKNYYKRKIK
jgi:hypothetical protein